MISAVAYQAQTAEPSPEEILSTLRTNLAGMSREELDKAAVEGILAKLYPRVLLTPSTEPGEPCTNCLDHSAVFEGAFGYIRLREVQTGLRSQISETILKLQGTNALKGLVLDLRFAGGTDYAAVPEVANLFVSEVKPLLDWGQGVVRSKQETNDFRAPLAILVNRETWGASEALAGALRESEAGLLLGSPTSGKAAVFKTFTLSTSQKIDIAVTEVKIGEGKPVPSTGIKPDIAVTVSTDDERQFLKDPYRVTRKGGGAESVAGAPGAGPGARISRLNEAELVRMRRENQGEDLERLLPGAIPQAKPDATPVVTDPALARALDLLKGLAVVRQTKGS